ncbi:hypothetical protein AWM70_21775 [Paenibacillus yonginensis]|uniref:Uncharacterized protein n=1 Tax=Paenibacillus yonginensis TaxID=1462996 RepID=A0A1B1N635_9BACL|nr:hypothetical protein [Paenibacillus yonginensis]ANS76886.1 hypothetical protein AWM70_21775 [Paenibacillus yonginensis]
MKKTKLLAVRSLYVLTLLLSGLFFLNANLPSAHANYFNDVYNGIKSFSEVPVELNRLQDNYDQAAQQLQDTQSSLETYRQQSEALAAQNEQLSAQNRQLAETVQTLQAINASREATSHKLRIMLYSAIGLFIGYFVFKRVVRVLLRK